jgi:hypothetical protein
MKWETLPGPARYIEAILQHLRNGTHVVVGAPGNSHPYIERAFADYLAHDEWYRQCVTVDSSDEPLRYLTDRLYLSPEKWVGWNVEKLFGQIEPNTVILVDGLTSSNWESWRDFLHEFEAVSRQSPSHHRPTLLIIVRGVPQKELQMNGAAIATSICTGVFGELDALTYIDHRLRNGGVVVRHHKLLVRQIAALALWDLELADYLIEQPERDVFDIHRVLRSARKALGRDGNVFDDSWEAGGIDLFDGVELLHPFLLLDAGDPAAELSRRVWTVQAAELLPLIEVRRRELIRKLQRHIACPFTIDGTRKIHSLDELEIGSLAFLTQIQGIRGELRENAEWLAHCRNTLAHLRLLNDSEALDSRLHG